MFTKYDIPWECIYLLQVRNVEWNKQQIKDMQHFITYLYDFAWEHVGMNRDALKDWLFKGTGFNMLSQPYGSVGRGLTCGI